MSKWVLVFVVAFLFYESLGYCCLFDTDCVAVGSNCVQEESSMEGLCKGGLGSDNSFNEEWPEFFPNLDTTVVDTCSFDTDCETDQRCVKKIGTIYGVCMTSEVRRDDRQD